MQTTAHKDYREHILALAQFTPVQPVQIAKELNTSSIIASAMLSEMSAKGILSISHLKVGSSPLYYVPTEAQKLLNYTHYLNEKDQKVLEKLTQEKILRDTHLEPLFRVSLRQQLKDFAKPLTVKYGEQQELFWKYFLTPDADAETLIKEVLQKKEVPLTPQPNIPLPTPPIINQPLPSIQQNQQEPQKIIPETERKIKKQISQQITQKLPLLESSKQEIKTEQKTLPDLFAQEISRHLTKRNITPLTHTIIKKNTELEGTIRMETPLGTITFYYKATNKKRITDADLTTTYVQGQLKKLPTIYLHKGDLTTKAKTILPNLTGLTLTKL